MTEPTIPERPERPTKKVKIGDIEVVAQTISEAQMMQLTHEAHLFQNPKIPIERKQKGLDRIFRILNSVVVSDTDREAVEDQIADGKVDAYDLVGILRDITSDGVTSQPRVRRGRPAQR